ncbi:gp53-like domain-containing protein [Cupriavidus respiraculi]|uniref:Putative tail fiber protein gp53-like C-terminal domain-containing protein n=1 Tax=Cupriavidus respiraculi TaxID=195930 RepID=A0ABM8WXK0_9BURK|nr:hypothetical protein [Cupriavidus respiraculi]CAG9172257.1 hypothetical protein LMG21510_01914 [Cupriavidus respiraculi]
MADVNFFDNFETQWAQNGGIETIDENQYRQGWAFIGSTPPSVEQFNRVQQLNDQKAAWLFAQIRNLAGTENLALASDTTDGLTSGIASMIQSAAPVAASDSGTANAYVVDYSPAVALLKDGMVLWFKARTGNTGVSTLNVNGLGPKPLVGPHAALQGGEIVAGGRCQAVWRADQEAWVLTVSTGGAAQVPPATRTHQAVSLGQFDAVLGNNGYQKLPGGWIVQWGSITTSAVADVSFTFPVRFPNAMRNAVATYHNFNGSNAAIASLGAFGPSAIGVAAYAPGNGARIAAQINVWALGH